MSNRELIKQYALDLHRTEIDQYLKQTRDFAEAHIRQHGQVTSDDVQAAVELPSGVKPAFVGQIFQDGRFIERGFTISKRPQAKGHVIRVWGLRGAA